MQKALDQSEDRPGADEDIQGEPFVGRAGQLLTKIIETMALKREQVYIANILKCRPDTPGQSYGNRAPSPEEMERCPPQPSRSSAGSDRYSIASGDDRSDCRGVRSAAVGRVSPWYIGAFFPSARAFFTSTSMALPFSACMQMSPPFSAVFLIALKIVASSTISTSRSWSRPAARTEFSSTPTASQSAGVSSGPATSSADPSPRPRQRSPLPVG